MSVRFIFERTVRDQGDVRKTYVTVDAECDAVEKVLTRGGWGGGPNGDDFDITKLVGAEVQG